MPDVTSKCQKEPSEVVLASDQDFWRFCRYSQLRGVLRVELTDDMFTLTFPGSSSGSPGTDGQTVCRGSCVTLQSVFHVNTTFGGHQHRQTASVSSAPGFQCKKSQPMDAKLPRDRSSRFQAEESTETGNHAEKFPKGMFWERREYTLTIERSPGAWRERFQCHRSNFTIT